MSPKTYTDSYFAAHYTPCDQFVYTIGGFERLACYKFHVTNQKWSEMPDMKEEQDVYPGTFIDKEKKYLYSLADSTIQRLSLKSPTAWEAV